MYERCRNLMTMDSLALSGSKRLRAGYTCMQQCLDKVPLP